MIERHLLWDTACVNDISYQRGNILMKMVLLLYILFYDTKTLFTKCWLRHGAEPHLASFFFMVDCWLKILVIVCIGPCKYSSQSSAAQGQNRYSKLILYHKGSFLLLLTHKRQKKLQLNLPQFIWETIG